MINSTLKVDTVEQFNANSVFYNAQGTMGTCTPGGVTNVDLKMLDDNFLTGGHLRVKGQTFGDFLHVQVVDKDNIIGYGANVVLRQFVTNWYLSADDSQQADFGLPYPAKVIAGLYIRIVYNSIALTGTPFPQLAINYDLHKALF